MDSPKLMSMADAAAALGLSRRTVERLGARGDLPVVRIGRRALIAPNDLAAFVRRSTQLAPEHRMKKPSAAPR